MQAARKLPDLIEAIYGAALAPALWSDVVVGIRDYVGGRACGLFSKDSISKFGMTHYYCGADPRYIQLYSETYSKFDPLTTLPPFGDVVSIPDLVPFDEFRRGRFYQEWLSPQGSVDAANVVLEKSNANCPILLTVLSGKRMVDDEMRRRISHIVPHAHRALTINKAIEFMASETAAFADTLNGLSAGVFILDTNCRIVHANTAGYAMLAPDDFLRSVDGQLVTRNANVNQTLRELFATNSEAAIAAKSVALPLTAHDGERYIAHILPLAVVARGGIGMANAVASVFVRKVKLDGNSYGDLIARTFGLTPAELRVLLAIVDVGGVPEAAETLGIAETTVKTHLYRVFSKTGASRQADLVKLAAGFSSP